MWLLFLGSGKFPVKFSCSTEGQYECHILLKSGLDIRLLVIEATVIPSNSQAQVAFKTNATIPLTQQIPVVRFKNFNFGKGSFVCIELLYECTCLG